MRSQEFAVPSGNITMQQMVARQVDLGTYAGPSFIIGNVKGGIVAIAVIENVGKTARITTRKDLNITKVEELRGKRIANQTGSSVGNDFVDIVMPHTACNKGDYQEVRMDVNNMVAALAAKTVDAMANVEPYNVIAVADGIGTDLVDFSSFDPMPVFMAATPDSSRKIPMPSSPISRPGSTPPTTSRTIRRKSTTSSTRSTPTRATRCRSIHSTALSRVEVNPGFPGDLKPYMQQQAEILFKDKTINAIPDWSKALRPDFMEKAAQERRNLLL